MAKAETCTLVKNYFELVRHDFLSLRRVSDYANKLCVSPNYLNSKIKAATGHTASYHIQQRIILEAKRQVQWNKLCMKEIAHQLGFVDNAHFSKFFKKATGTNFSAFVGNLH